MQMPFDLSHHVPEFLTDIREFKAIFESENTEFDRIELLRRQAIANRFYDEIDKETCERYEKILNLDVGSNDTLDDRRFRIKSMMCMINHYLIQTLENLCGTNNVSVNFKPNEYFIEIRIGLSSKRKSVEARKLVKRMLPCNMFLVFDLKYNTYKDLSGFTHEYLGSYTQEQLRSELLN